MLWLLLLRDSGWLWWGVQQRDDALASLDDVDRNWAAFPTKPIYFSFRLRKNMWLWISTVFSYLSAAPWVFFLASQSWTVSFGRPQKLRQENWNDENSYTRKLSLVSYTSDIFGTWSHIISKLKNPFKYFYLRRYEEMSRGYQSCCCAFCYCCCCDIFVTLSYFWRFLK